MGSYAALSGELSITRTNTQSDSVNGTDGAEHYAGTPVLPNQQLKLTVGVSCSTGWCNSNKKRTSFYRRLARRCTDSEIFTCTLPQVSRQSLGSNTGEVLIKESSRVTSCITLVLRKTFGSKHTRFPSPIRLRGGRAGNCKTPGSFEEAWRMQSVAQPLAGNSRWSWLASVA